MCKENSRVLTRCANLRAVRLLIVANGWMKNLYINTTHKLSMGDTVPRVKDIYGANVLLVSSETGECSIIECLELMIVLLEYFSKEVPTV